MAWDTKLIWDIHTALGWAFIVVSSLRNHKMFIKRHFEKVSDKYRGKSWIQQAFGSLLLSAGLVVALTTGVLVWPVLLAVDVFLSIRKKR